MGRVLCWESRVKLYTLVSISTSISIDSSAKWLLSCALFRRCVLTPVLYRSTRADISWLLVHNTRVDSQTGRCACACLLFLLPLARQLREGNALPFLPYPSISPLTIPLSCILRQLSRVQFSVYPYSYPYPYPYPYPYIYSYIYIYIY
jgi:hypothetical protein